MAVSRVGGSNVDDAADYLFQPGHRVLHQPQPQHGERQHHPPTHEQVRDAGAAASDAMAGVAP